MNSEHVLEQLRNKYRVPQPRFVSHPLIRAARRVTGVPVYHYKVRRHFSPLVHWGSSPADLFYEDGNLYVGNGAAVERNSLWHDLCHVMVAEKAGKLGKTNFNSTHKDEMVTCKIEFWLGYVAGFYSYEYLLDKITAYGYTDTLHPRGLGDGTFGLPHDWYTGASVEKYLLTCRKTALRVPGACRLARELGVYSKAALVEKMRKPRKLYA